MNDIDNMPSKCQLCPYWEACKYPYICDDMKPKQNERCTEITMVERK